MKTLKHMLIEKQKNEQRNYLTLVYLTEAQIAQTVGEWLEQWRSDPDGIQTVDEVGQIQLEFLNELEGKIQENRRK